MLSLTIIVFIVGVITVVAGWIVAVRLIGSDRAGGSLVSPTTPVESAPSSELADAHSR